MFLGPPEGLALIVLKMLHLNRSTYLDTVDGNHAEPFRTSFLEDKTWSKGYFDFFLLMGTWEWEWWSAETWKNEGEA